MIGLFSAIVSGVSALVTTLGSPAVALATSLVTKLPQILEVARVVLHEIAEVITGVAQILDILLEDENAEELGAKAKQDGTRERMEDESMEDYINYLRNEVELDKEKLSKMSVQEKFECEAVGTGMLSVAIKERTNVSISPEFLLAMNKMKMTDTQLTKYINNFSKNGIESMDSFTKFLEGKLSDSELKEISSIIETVEKEIDPETTDLDIYEQIEEYKEAYNAET